MCFGTITTILATFRLSFYHQNVVSITTRGLSPFNFDVNTDRAARAGITVSSTICIFGEGKRSGGGDCNQSWIVRLSDRRSQDREVVGRRRIEESESLP